MLQRGIANRPRMSELPKTFEPRAIEDRWYAHWEEKGLFRPEVECIIVESVDPEGPFGAKEASEGSLAATIPAIANAIYDAVGVRLREAPFTPERVLAAIKAKQSEKKALDITRGDDPVTPTTFREHGGSLWFKGKGPHRHADDPSRRVSEIPSEAREPYSREKL